MQIQLFSSFSKRENSTKRPTGTVDKTLTGYLREPSSVEHPVFRIERLPQDASPSIYTYAIIPAFQRFYFVDDWVWSEGLWEAHLTEDVLASFRTEIGGQNEYILRTNSTTDFNGEITDITYPATNTVNMITAGIQNIFTSDLTVGCYIVGIISGGSADAVGAISYFAMTSTQFGALKDKLFSDDNLEIMGIIDSQGAQLVQDLSQEVLKTLYNPYQYIVSCMWFPFGVSAIDQKTSVTSIKIGWWDYPLSGYLLYAQSLELGDETIDIDAHPQASRGSYLNYAPYTRRTLIGRFGTVAVDLSLFNVGDEIAIIYTIDLITGMCIANISRRTAITVEGEPTHNYDLIAQRNFLIGVPIQIAQVGTDYLGTAVQAINTAGAMLNGAGTGLMTGGIAGAIAGGIVGGANGLYNTLQSAMPQVETGGQNGSFLAPLNQTHMITQFRIIVDEDISHRGRPLCENRQINTLSGFILCAEGDMNISCFDSERKAISNYLTNGFFWE